MTNLRARFPLSSDDCELLLEFELCSSLQELALRMHRDHSILTRAIKRLAEQFPVVEKQNGKWTITELGRRINESSRLTIIRQTSILNETSTMRIGTNREFGARVIGVDFQVIQELFPRIQLTINTYEQGVERALLDGVIDIGFDCDRPFSPEVAYKLVAEEPILAVATKEFVKKYKNEIALGKYATLPHLFCHRLNPDKILSQNENQFVIKARFNDIATTKAVCLQGVGWALLPSYAIKDELKSKSLVLIDQQIFGNSKYGVWWLRSRTHFKEASEKLIYWLQSQEL